MSVAASAGAASAAAVATANAIRSSGVIVRMKPEEFLRVLQRSDSLLVVTAAGGFFSKVYYYLTSYKGLAFYTESPEPLSLPENVERIAADAIFIPS